MGENIEGGMRPCVRPQWITSSHNCEEAAAQLIKAFGKTTELPMKACLCSNLLKNKPLKVTNDSSYDVMFIRA